MSQSVFPIWFRAYIIIPILAVAYFIIPLRWNFSPYALTHSLPPFLLGATDWGTGNIYTFAKIVYWISMMLGGSANSLCEQPASMNIVSAIKWRFMHNVWHVGAALCLPLLLTFLPGGKGCIDLLDMWLLAGYFTIGVLAVLVIVSFGQRHMWSTCVRFCWAVAAGIAWGFVPVAIGCP
ncbi:MAG: hypothetical protein EPN23_04770 [Verrucomicrobia bacterium]|nr:MAG: hypothetical protein EPN23_04770 [Verrucomicrobiota bacterium]